MKGFIAAALGFAAGERGEGIAYVRFPGVECARVLRVPFTVKRFAGLQDREVGYAAVRAVAEVLRKRGAAAAAFHIEDPALAGDLREHRDVPAALTLAYVRLRCALNRFDRYEVHAAAESDLTARARSEAALHVAA
ncbi:MAG: hypothetical protein ABR508_03665 [Candidatus Baltobacteraceae bacterium]